FPAPAGPFSAHQALTFSTQLVHNLHHEDSRSHSPPCVPVPSRHWDSAHHPGLRRWRRRDHNPPQRPLRGPRRRRHGVPVLRINLPHRRRSSGPRQPRPHPHLEAHSGLLPLRHRRNHPVGPRTTPVRYRRLQTLGFVALLATLSAIHCLPTEVQADRRRSTTFLAATDDTVWPEWDGVTAHPELTDAHPTTGWPRDYGRICVTFTAGPSGETRVIIDGRTDGDDPRPYLDVVNDGRIRFGIQTVGSIADGAVIPGKVHTACVDRSYGPITSLYLDGRLIGTSTTLPAWDWHPTARL